MSTVEPTRVPRDPETAPGRGQILVLFALALVAIVAVVGLILDGGATFAQRRGQQNAADMAALAGANDYLLNNSATTATARAKAVALQNGYADAVGAITVGVTIDTTNGAAVTVNISAPHQNNFASIVGMPTWTVSTTATALTGFPDTATGAAPFIMSVDAFGTNGQPLPLYGTAASPYNFGGCGDVPAGPGEFAWTNYGTGNVDTAQVRNIIDGSLVITKTIQFGTYIGQHNQGCHTALYSPVATYLTGQDVPIPIVDHNGNFQGWATFHVTGADGANGKYISGYFVSNFVDQLLTVGNCAAGQCPRYLGSYVLKLSN
jgi:Flp pilus assembly protein TadG